MPPAALLTIIYVRVSTRHQKEDSQLADLEGWVAGQRCTVTWLRDEFTGKTMARPGWSEVMRLVRLGQVSRIVVWRLDRLGRTAREMTALFRELLDRDVTLLSLREGIDLATAAGRLIAHVIASVAEYETELRGERVAAGQAAARAAGKRWGGSAKGRVYRLTEAKRRTVLLSFRAGATVAEIARAVELDRHTVYKVLRAAGLKPAPRRRRRRRA